jgi:hypothetical protein
MRDAVPWTVRVNIGRVTLRLIAIKRMAVCVRVIRPNRFAIILVLRVVTNLGQSASLSGQTRTDLQLVTEFAESASALVKQRPAALRITLRVSFLTRMCLAWSQISPPAVTSRNATNRRCHSFAPTRWNRFAAIVLLLVAITDARAHAKPMAPWLATLGLTENGGAVAQQVPLLDARM